MALLRSVRFALPDWREEAAAGTMRLWRHPNGAVLSLDVVNDAEGIGSSDDVVELRETCRQLAQANGGGLIEVGMARESGVDSVHLIYKRPNGAGFMFTGMRFMPVDDQCLVWTVVDGERGATGVREAVVTAQLLKAGTLTIDTYERSWAQDPYDADYTGVDRSVLRYLSDDEQYDIYFPQHPLSHVRHLLRTILTTASIEST